MNLDRKPLGGVVFNYQEEQANCITQFRSKHNPCSTPVGGAYNHCVGLPFLCFASNPTHSSRPGIMCRGLKTSLHRKPGTSHRQTFASQVLHFFVGGLGGATRSERSASGFLSALKSASLKFIE